MTRSPLALLIVACLTAAACSAQESPSAVAASPAAPSAPASAAPSAASPSAAPSGSAVAGDGTLEPRWVRQTATGLDGFEVAFTVAGATDGGTLVVVGQREVGDEDSGSVSQATAWSSADGLTWTASPLAGSDDAQVTDVTVGAGGFVAVGGQDDRAAVWLSADGASWEAVADDGFAPGRMWHVGATPQGLVAFGDTCCGEEDGDDGVIWTSEDGRSWLRATNETGLEVAAGIVELVAGDGRLIAFVDADGATEVWETSGRAEWERTGTLAVQAGTVRAAHGPLGWVVVVDDRAWRSADGRTWQEADNGPVFPQALVVDAAGIVAVSSINYGGGGCAEAWPAFTGETWASVDGRSWSLLPSDRAFEQAGIFVLLPHGRTLVGVGASYGHGDRPATLPEVWTAELPDRATTVAGTVPEPTPAPSAEPGCGEEG